MNEIPSDLAVVLQSGGDETNATLFLGDNLLPWLLLAFGAALVVANVAALVRPPRVDPDDPNSPRAERAPLRRVVPFMVVGVIVAAWAVASLVEG